jgi:hypothetical protein
MIPTTPVNATPVSATPVSATPVSATLGDRLTDELLAHPAGTEQLRALADRARTDPHLQAGAADGILLRPIVLTGAEQQDLAADLAALHRILLSLPERLYGGDVEAMCDALGFPPVHTAAVEATWRDDAVVLSRVDLMRDPGGFRAVEVNLHSSLGGIDSGPWHRAMLDVPAIADFAARHALSFLDPLDGVTGALRAAARSRGLGAFPTVAIVDWPSTFPLVQARLGRLARLLTARGLNAFACHAGELSHRSGRLYARGCRVDVLYRIFVIDNVSQNPALLGPVLTAHRAGNLVLAMGFSAELIGNKGTLAMAGDPEHAASFTAAERAVLDRMLPWTRFVREPLLETAMREQHDLILKPVGGYGARGVLPGWATDAQTWSDALAGAVGRPWVLQRRVRPVTERTPALSAAGLGTAEMDVNWGAFLVGDRYSGMMIRAVPSVGGGLISTSTGASIGACFTQRP